MLRCLLWGISAVFRPKLLLIANNLYLRQQLLVLHRRNPRPRLRDADRRFWILACRSLPRKVKKLKRRQDGRLSTASMAAPQTVRYNFWAINDARAAAGSGKGAVYGLGAHPGLRHRGGGPRAAGAERISGHRKPHSEGAVERAAEALRRQASHAWRDRSSLGPQTPCRGRNCGEAGHHPGVVPQACRPQIRWLEGASRSGQTSDQARARAADRAHGQREPGLGL